MNYVCKCGEPAVCEAKDIGLACKKCLRERDKRIMKKWKNRLPGNRFGNNFIGWPI